MLGVDAEFAAVAPLRLAGKRVDRADERSQERRLALAVVAYDRRPGAVLDLHVDAVGDGALRIADGEATAADGRPLAGIHRRALDRGGGRGRRYLLDLEPLKLPGLRPGPRGR